MVEGRTSAEPLINEVVLRTQAQAEYAAENYGHFGLNLRRYAHFTSPIRRYADLIVHRALIRALKLGDGGLPEHRDGGNAAPRSRPRSRPTERRAMTAERETVDRLIAHFLADRIGATFEGRISGVTRAGLFVKLDDTGADGFIPVRTHRRRLLSATTRRRHALIGERSGEMHRLGDRVEVRLVEAAPVAGALRFELLDGGNVDRTGVRPHTAVVAAQRERTVEPRLPAALRRPKPSKTARPRSRRQQGQGGKAKSGTPKKG